MSLIMTLCILRNQVSENNTLRVQLLLKQLINGIWKLIM